MNHNIIYYLLLAAVLSPALSFAQTKMINNGGIIRINAATHVRVNGGIDNKAATANINNSGNLYLDDDFSQITAASYLGAGASWLWFEGTVLQNISGDAPINVARLRTDNNNIVNLQQEVRVSTDIDLRNNSHIRLNNFNLVAPNVNIAGYDVNHYIITNGTGVLRQQLSAGDIKTYPIGNSRYNPAILSSNAGVPDFFDARLTDNILLSGTTGSNETTHHVNRSWHISEATIGGNNIDILVEWAAAEELSLFSRNLCGVKHWNGSSWDLPSSFTPAATVSAGRFNQLRTAQTTFSPFAVLDDNILPIALLDFDAQRQNRDKVLLDWATSSELNSTGFDVERMLDNETDFSKVGFVTGAGTSNERNNYAYQDANPYPNTSYYRLRQVDFDGNFSYSPVRAVRGAAQDNAATVSLYPNPAQSVAYLRFGDLAGEQAVRLRLLDAKGVQLEFFEITAVSYQVFPMTVSHLPSGTYVLEFRFGDGVAKAIKFIRE